MKRRDKFESNDAGFDELDAKIHQALKEEGAIIPTNVEDVRRAKARLKARPVTVPPHLKNSSAIIKKRQDEEIVLEAKNIIPCAAAFGRQTVKPGAARKAPDEFVEAIVISQLTRLLATPEWPLGRLRYNKLAYLSHRKAEEDVTKHYFKKAAGPYSPWAKYQGPENIAVKKGYVMRARAGPKQGLVAGVNIDEIDQYLPRYPVCEALEWIVGEFRFRRNEELELVATVDFAALDLIEQGATITMENVKHVIATNTEWAPKLNREIFSELNIAKTLSELKKLFPTTYV